MRGKKGVFLGMYSARIRDLLAAAKASLRLALGTSL